MQLWIRIRERERDENIDIDRQRDRFFGYGVEQVGKNRIQIEVQMVPNNTRLKTKR